MSLRKLTLTHNSRKGTWDLKEDKSRKVIHSYKAKENATKGGALERALGKQGGSVKMMPVREYIAFIRNWIKANL